MQYFSMILICLGLILPVSAMADDAQARSIMQKVEDRDDGDNMMAELEMILIDKRGHQRIRKIKSYMKDRGQDTLGIMFFIYPADIKDTGFLTFDYDAPGQDDDQWLYLPALRKTKRIASHNKSGSFMGSDLNYSDMTSRDLKDYDFTLKKEMDLKGFKTWMIESLPRTRKVIKETGYKKSLLFVRQDNYVVIRAVSWVKSGSDIKYMDVKNLKKIDGVWVAMEMHVTRKKGKKVVHKTILKQSKIQFNQKFEHDFFTKRRLEKGL